MQSAGGQNGVAAWQFSLHHASLTAGLTDLHVPEGIGVGAGAGVGDGAGWPPSRSRVVRELCLSHPGATRELMWLSNWKMFFQIMDKLFSIPTMLLSIRFVYLYWTIHYHSEHLV